MAMDRSTFEEQQVTMTARWADGIRAAGHDVEAYFARRRAAYLDRWREALRFLTRDARVLDIGGGNGFPELYALLRRRGIDYWYQDVDQDAVASSAKIAEECGLGADRFRHGFNDELHFEDGAFDAVFSSHCIEHSSDLPRTFSEIRRILVPGGTLLMAVPMGWEPNPAHPYYFDQQEWLRLVLDAGFDIRTAQIGREYPEQGYDLFICASRTDRMPSTCLELPRHTKANYEFVSPYDADLFELTGEWVDRGDHLIGHPTAELVARPGRDCTDFLPILGRHAWSGIVQISGEEGREYSDLYSWFPFAHPYVSCSMVLRSALHIRTVGRSTAARDTQVVLYGALCR